MATEESFNYLSRQWQFSNLSTSMTGIMAARTKLNEGTQSEDNNVRTTKSRSWKVPGFQNPYRPTVTVRYLRSKENDTSIYQIGSQKLKEKIAKMV